MNKQYTTIQLLAAALVIAVAAGCNSQEKPKLSTNDHFRPDDEPRAVNRIFDRQIANAAHDDGQLHASHFTGSELNSLGKAKLNAMSNATSRGKMFVYLDIPKDGAYGERESSVTSYLAGLGLTTDSYAVVAGPNLTDGTPVAPGLRGLAKQAGSSQQGGSGQQTSISIRN